MDDGLTIGMRRLLRLCALSDLPPAALRELLGRQADDPTPDHALRQTQLARERLDCLPTARDFSRVSRMQEAAEAEAEATEDPESTPVATAAPPAEPAAVTVVAVGPTIVEVPTTEPAAAPATLDSDPDPAEPLPAGVIPFRPRHTDHSTPAIGQE